MATTLISHAGHMKMPLSERSKQTDLPRQVTSVHEELLRVADM